MRLTALLLSPFVITYGCMAHHEAKATPLRPEEVWDAAYSCGVRMQVCADLSQSLETQNEYLRAKVEDGHVKF